MELKKLLTPWNWFKKEEEQSQLVTKSNVSKVDENPLVRLQQDIDKLFEGFFQGFPVPPFQRERSSLWSGMIMPQVDISENKKSYTITVEVPGVDEKDIELTLGDGTLIVRGEKRSETEDKDKQYHRIERTYGAFQRVLSLPPDADENKIDAKFKNGVLTITVAKNPEVKPAVRTISINK